MTNSNLTLDLFYSKDNEVKRRTDSYLIKEFNDRTIRVYSIIPRLPTMLFKIEQILTKTVIFWEQQALTSGIKQLNLEAT